MVSFTTSGRLSLPKAVGRVALQFVSTEGSLYMVTPSDTGPQCLATFTESLSVVAVGLGPGKSYGYLAVW